MPASGVLRRVAVVRTDVSVERYRVYHQDDKNRRVRNIVSSNYQPKHTAKGHAFFRSVLRLLVTADLPSSSILSP
jgi:hypothetical protein